MKSKKSSPTPAAGEDSTKTGSSSKAPRPSSLRSFDLRSIRSSMKGVFSRRSDAASGDTGSSKSGGDGAGGGGGFVKTPNADGLEASSTTTVTSTTVSTSATLLSVCRAASTSDAGSEKAEASSPAGGSGPSSSSGPSGQVEAAAGSEKAVQAPPQQQSQPPPQPPPPPPPVQDAGQAKAGGEEGEGLAGLVGAEGEQFVRRLEKSASFLAAAAGGAAASLTSLIGSSPSQRPRRTSSSEKDNKPGAATTNERVATIMELAEQEEHDALALDPALLSSYDGTETLSRNHPVFQMIKQRSQIVGKASGDAVGPRKESGGTEIGNSGAGRGASGDGVKVEELASSNSSSSSLSSASGSSSSGPHPHSSGSTDLKPGSTEANSSGSGSNALNASSSNTTTTGNDGEDLDAPAAAPAQEEAYTPFAARKKTEYHYGYVEKLVLKFTTYSQNNEESAFVIGKAGGSIGRDASNTVSVPSDLTLQKECHALIGHKAGSFFLKNQGSTHCAAIRIGTEPGLRDWPLVLGATFSAGNSIFVVKELTGGELIAEVIDGPLKGERRRVGQKGATLGRSPDNTLSIADPELSRRHSRIEYDDKDGKYYLSDVGSTNGTYMQLAGPYAKVFYLSLGDEIMVGRTGFSINRYDYGISEERGRRKTMEDHTLVIQDLGVRALKRFGLAPQTFAAVFDGHGGEEASAYLARYLHVNLIETLERRFGAVPGGKLPGLEEVDEMVKVAVLEAFHKTDSDFLTKGNVDAGSTANTVLIMGRRVYSCNVGDSRTIISREQKLLLCSNDHKPAREDEARRIREAGGFIFQNRVMGELAVSRAFGDRELKKCMQEIMAPEELEQMSLRDAKSDGEEALVKDYSQPLVIARPEFLVSELTEKDDFVLLACDGLFDVFPNTEVVRFVLEEMRQHRDAQRACENLSYTAIHQRIAHDNVSIVLLVTNKWW